MALTPQSSEAFVREVDEELRRDRAEALWRRYGKVAIAAVVVVLVALAAFLWWRQHQAAKAGAAGEQLSQALQELGDGRENAARAKLAAVKQEGGAYAALARMAEASLAAQKKDAKAPAAFDAIAKDTSVPQAIRDVATLRAAALRFDTAPPAETVAALAGLAQKGNAFYGSAAEMTALSYLKMGRTKDAQALLRAIAADETVPESLRDRVARLATVTGAAPVAAAAPAAAPRP
ncbi:MAG: tetratricopeptide repeat protein [Sphingomonas fennica]